MDNDGTASAERSTRALTKDRQGHLSLIDIAREISAQKDYGQLFRLVVEEVVAFLGAEGGTLYLHDKETHSLQAVIAINRKLGLEHICHNYNPAKIKGMFGIDLAGRDQGQPMATVAGACWQRKATITITNTVREDKFDLAGVHDFDRRHNYHTDSLIAVPLLSRDRNVLGLVQAVNILDADSVMERLDFVETVSSIMGMVLENNLLLQNTENLLRSVIGVIAAAIDERCKVTSGHCQRVTDITLRIIQALNDYDRGRFKDTSFSEQEIEEIRIAAQLHDIGKIATPDIVLEKKSKLHAVIDRIGEIRARFKLRRAELRIAQLEAALKTAGQALPPASESTKDDDDMQFLEKLNFGSEQVDGQALKRLAVIADRLVVGQPLLSEEEHSSLAIARGTLTPEERKKMEHHATISIRLLDQLPWPPALAKVPEIAGKHHENLDGSGYPNGVRGEDMSLPARVLSIADRFEGLSAPDRQYRAVKKLSQVLQIMDDMSDQGLIDSELYDFFIARKLHLDYAHRYLPPELIDID